MPSCNARYGDGDYERKSLNFHACECRDEPGLSTFRPEGSLGRPLPACSKGQMLAGKFGTFENRQKNQAEWLAGSRWRRSTGSGGNQSVAANASTRMSEAIIFSFAPSLKVEMASPFPLPLQARFPTWPLPLPVTGLPLEKRDLQQAQANCAHRIRTGREWRHLGSFVSRNQNHVWSCND